MADQSVPTRVFVIARKVTLERAWAETLEQLDIERQIAVLGATCDMFPAGKELSRAFGFGVPATVPVALGKRTG